MSKNQLSSRFTVLGLLFIAASVLVIASDWGISSAHNRAVESPRVEAVAVAAAPAAKVTAEPRSPFAPRAVRWVSPSGPVNTDVFGEVAYEAQASDTAAIQFSIHFDPAVASISNVSGVNLNPDITLGAGAPAGTTINVNAASAAAGDIGIGLNFNGANTNPPTVITIGTKRIVRLKFRILATAALGVSPVTFTNTVVNRFVSDANGFPITTPPFTDGNITVTGARTLKIGSSLTRAGGTALVPVTLTAIGGTNPPTPGAEYGVSLTVNWDPTLLSITGVAGTDVLPGATVLPASCVTTINNTGVAAGRLGIGIGCANGGLPAGIDEIFRLKFTALAAAAPGTVIPVIFGNTPINTEVGDSNGNTLTVDKVPGAVTILGPTAAMVSVSGRVTTPNGAGLRNARVTLTDVDGNVRTATTSSFGFYQFDEVESGSTYIMSVSSRSYRFGSRSVSVTDNVTDMDFIGLE